MAAVSAIHDDPERKRLFRTSIIFMGLGHLLQLKQYVKGALFALMEILFLIFIPTLFGKVHGLITLGDPKPDLPMIERDHSMFMMIDGITVLAVIFLFFVLYALSVKSALSDYDERKLTGKNDSGQNIFSELANKSFPILGLMPALILVIFFIIVPLLFSALVAFTDYSAPDHIPPNNVVNWVGLENFRTLFGGNNVWGGAFGRVALWTILWGAAATVTCYAGGIIMATVLTQLKIRLISVFRSIYILPYAIPIVVSMMIWRNLLNGSFGIVNRTLLQLGLIDKSSMIPWLSDPTLAKIICIVINLWAGFPYFMLLTMGTMTSISGDQFEAAQIDGASNYQTFRYITLPQVLYQTMPLIIMSFTFNINNFGAIFFLTGGDPIVSDSTLTGAGGTDILVTWIYKLTINLLKYNYASVIAICIFAILAPFAIYNFRRTKSFKEGEI